MREIKFRAWDERNRKMSSTITFRDLVNYYAHGEVNWPKHPTIMPVWIDIIWMQYTGLKDKANREIFEGDIIKLYHPNYYEYFKGTVSYDNKQAAFFCSGEAVNRITYSDNRPDVVVIHTYAYLFEHDEIEIIGNIYENPELIK